MSEHIIEMLQAFRAPFVFNPWRDTDPLDLYGGAADARCERLTAHFAINPSYLLVGEAPGYQGCHFSGVPFTNESLLCAGRIPRMSRQARFTSRERPWCEPSATIVWNALHDHGIADDVVLWNAFAFHPHKPDLPLSNRAPTRIELEAGKEILAAVIKYFTGATVVAVGKVAAKALGTLGVRDVVTIRHPSMGGANAFRAGIRDLI